MGDDRVTPRQARAAAFTALLAPLIRVLPRGAAALAGRGAWLSVFAAAPALLALALLLRSLCRALAPGEGLAPLFLRVFGPVLGRALLVLYGGWSFLYAGFVLRGGAERLAAAAYPHSGPEPFILAMLALSLLASLGTVRGLARTGAVLRGLLLGVLLLMFLLALRDLDPENLFPLRDVRPRDVLLGALPAATVGGAAALFSFLAGYAEPSSRPGRDLASLLLCYLLTASALCLTTVGSFGAGLTTRLSYPFFTMLRDITLFGAAQRFEAAVIALWVFSDLLLCTLLLRCGNEAWRTVFALPVPEGDGPLRSLRRGRWLLWVGAALAGGCAALVSPSSEVFRLWTDRLAPLLMDLFVWGGLPLLWLVGRLRKIV